MIRWKTQKLIEADSDASYAYYCLHKLHIKPSEYTSMDDYEKAFIIAAIQKKQKRDKKEADQIKRSGKKKGR